MERTLNGPDAADPAADPGLSLQIIRHELRTPVNHIIGYSEMLLEEAADIPEPERFAALNEVVAVGRRMLTVIGESLTPPDTGERTASLSTLHTRLRPHLNLIQQICTELQQIAGADNLASFTADLRKIAAATTSLYELATGIASLSPTAAPNMYAQMLTGDSASQPHEASDGRLLVVDDNAMNRDMLARRLERLGYQVALAENGREALDLAAAEPFDLMLLDIMMPEMDGYAVLQALKAHPELRRLPVIILSALDDMESVVRGVELGADDYLPKPFDTVLLKARISACLFKKRMRDMEVDYLKRIEDEKRRADDLLHVVIPIGVALSGEKDFNQLLERIVLEAQSLCNADAGTLYLRTEDHKLRFVIVRNRSLNIAMGGATGKDIPFPPLRLFDEQTGDPHDNYVVARAALNGETINIADAYNAEGYDFSGTREFDQRTHYRSTSMLTIPLKDGGDKVIGVLQLINAQDAEGQVVPFDDVAEQMIMSMGTLAAAALAAYAREQQLRQEIDNLRIEIDQVKKRREVEQITSSSYFSELQERARQLRAGNPASGDSPGGISSRRERGTEPVATEFHVDGQTIRARVLGAPTRRLLLLIHGWSSSWYALSPLLPQLSERFRCVAVDLPGFGESPPLKERASIPRYAELLAKLIRQLSPNQPAVLVGHSMGGMISVTMALNHPEVIERMVLVCPTISGKLSAWINTMIAPITFLERSRLANRIVGTFEPYLLNVTDLLMKPASFAERSGITQADYVKLRADARRVGQGRVRAECFSAMRENDLQGRLGGISTPTLVIWGMEDNTVPLRDASVVADEWPSADLKVLPKAGHWPQFETQDFYQRYLRGFLNRPIKLLTTDL